MARRAPSQGDREVRLSFQLFASDNPLLVADLLRVRKGRLRHARLVTLATLGLIIETRMMVGEVQPPASKVPSDTPDLQPGVLSRTDLELIDDGRDP